VAPRAPDIRGVQFQMNMQPTNFSSGTQPNHSVLDDFSKWKAFLGEKVDHAHAVGMSDKQIEDVAVHLGGYLADKIDPENPQERLLKQLWEVTPKEDRKVFARAMINLVDRDGGAPKTH